MAGTGQAMTNWVSVGHRGRHEAIYRPASCLLPAVAVPVVGDDLFLCPGDRRPGVLARRARGQRSRHRRDGSSIRPRPPALGAIRALHGEPRARRPRQVVLLPRPGYGPVSVAATELALLGGSRD